MIDTSPVIRCRSALYVIPSRSDQLSKAVALDADVLVLELEDGVPSDGKEEARLAAAGFLADPPTTKPVEVRVNALGAGLLLDDLLAVARSGVSAIRLPKVESPDDVIAVCRMLDEIGSSARVVPILESARGLAAAAAIASSNERVGGLLLGEEDLRADLNCGPRGLLSARSSVVVAARAAGLPAPMQSVWTDIADLDGLRADCELGRDLGFGGRSVIHPAQIAVVNEVYGPTASEIAWAKEVLAGPTSGGRTLADGQFIDGASQVRAQQILRAVSPGGTEDVVG